MYQGEDRSPEQRARFKWTMQHINLLYIGCSVLILQELSYMSRFWTQFEAWCSMQQAGPHGLEPAPEEKRRCSVIPIHHASEVRGVAEVGPG